MDPQRPSFMITGTGVPGKTAAKAAYGGFWLTVGSEAIQIPGAGLGPLGHSFPRVADELRRRIDQLGRPALVAGHSQGGFDAVMFGLKYPEYVHSVMAISTPFGGLDYSIAEMRRGLRRIIKGAAGPLSGLVSPIWYGLEPSVQRVMKARAPSLHSLAWLGDDVVGLQDSVCANWSPTVRLALVGSIDDKLVRVSRNQYTAFDLKIPNGEPERYCLYTGAEPDLNLEDVQYVRSERGGHLSMVGAKALYRLVMRYSYPPESPPVNLAEAV